MQLSQRIQGINGGGSDGWEVFYRAREMRSAGIAVTELTVGDHDIPTAPEILTAMYEAARKGHTGYADIHGIPALRAAVAARHEARQGVATRPENVLITAGGQAALFAALQAVADPGDQVLFIDPYYATYPGTIRATGLIPVAVPTRPENGFLPEPATLRPIAGNARALLINSPNNPTGVVYDRATLEGIGALAQAEDLWLISDEVYETQVWQGRHLSPRALPGLAERTLVIGSMSKSHAMTGARLGWIIAPEAVIEALYDLAVTSNYGNPGFIQEAAEFALGLGEIGETRVAAPFRRRREIALRLLGGQNLVRAVPSQGAMFVMLDIRATGLSGTDFALALLEQEHIAVMPGESFGSAAAGHIRLALTLEDSLFEATLARVLAFAARQSGS